MGPMKALTGDLAIMTDAHPLAPQITLRLALPLDPPCACGDAATFVLLKADVAKHAPHLPNLEDRMSYLWLHVHESVCGNHVAMAIRDIGSQVALNVC